MKFVETHYTDSAAKIMAEAVAKTGAYDIFNQFPSVVPDAAGAGVILPLDEYAAGSAGFFRHGSAAAGATAVYHGKLYFLLLSGDQLMLVLRKALLELPGSRKNFRPGMAGSLGALTLAQWEQLAEFFHTKKGQTRWGKTFDYDLYGALGDRSMNFPGIFQPTLAGSSSTKRCGHA